MGISLNQITITGNVGRDAEIREVGSTRCAEFSVATSERWKAKDGSDQTNTDWHRVIVWGPFAGVVGQHVRKGMMVTVTGSIHYRDWTDKDGAKRTSAEIKATDVIWSASSSGGGSGSGSRPSSSSARPAARPKVDRFDDGDVPF